MPHWAAFSAHSTQVAQESCTDSTSLCLCRPGTRRTSALSAVAPSTLSPTSRTSRSTEPAARSALATVWASRCSSDLRGAAQATPPCQLPLLLLGGELAGLPQHAKAGSQPSCSCHFWPSLHCRPAQAVSTAWQPQRTWSPSSWPGRACTPPGLPPDAPPACGPRCWRPRPASWGQWRRHSQAGSGGSKAKERYVKQSGTAGSNCNAGVHAAAVKACRG
jgi:hypothetical protein